MKRFFIGLMLIVMASVAVAGDLVMVSPSKGGNIFITTKLCDYQVSGLTAFKSYAITDGGRVQPGCYTLEGNTIVAVWFDEPRVPYIYNVKYFKELK